MEADRLAGRRAGLGSITGVFVEETMRRVAREILEGRGERPSAGGVRRQADGSGEVLSAAPAT